MVAFAVGFWIGGFVCWIVIRRQTDISDEDRLTSYQTAAFIAALAALVLVAGALAAGELPGVIAAAATLAVAVLAVLKIGFPEQHPVWRRLSSRRHG